MDPPKKTLKIALIDLLKVLQKLTKMSSLFQKSFENLLPCLPEMSKKFTFFILFEILKEVTRFVVLYFLTHIFITIWAPF